ncbi:MAG: glycosyltransferase family 2 protein [Gammaproteobacteria bacterium]|nr:glycosyltransferase family 2 protein [Gammaproteobacteria bacterium]
MASSPQPLVSVVMLCWNRRDEVNEGLRQLQRSDYPRLEIIVVDNGSEDGTAAMVASSFPQVSLLPLPKNIGIAAYNRGFAVATGQYIIVLDDDSYPLPDAPGKMVSRFERDPTLGVVAFAVRNLSGFAGEAYKRHREGGEAAGCGEQYSFNGAGFGVRRDLFQRIGWYPEEFFLYWNEQDTAFRLLAAGYRIENCPDIVALHKFSPRNRSSERAPFFYTRNAFWLIWKHYPLDLALLTTLRLLFHVVLHSLEQRSLVYLRAAVAAWRGVSVVAAKRKAVARQSVLKARISYENIFTQFR